MQGPSRARPDPRLLLDPGHLLALGGGSGLLPLAPGTWGSLVGVGVYLAMSDLPLGAYLAVVLFLFALGVPLCGRAATALGRSDPGAIVLDEIVGYLLTVTFCSTGTFGVITGFLLFRFFDIVKPWPVRLVDERVHGGLGIMLDDVVAAIYGIISLKIIEYFSLSYIILR